MEKRARIGFLSTYDLIKCFFMNNHLVVAPCRFSAYLILFQPPNGPVETLFTYLKMTIYINLVGLNILYQRLIHSEPISTIRCMTIRTSTLKGIIRTLPVRSCWLQTLIIGEQRQVHASASLHQSTFLRKTQRYS